MLETLQVILSTGLWVKGVLKDSHFAEENAGLYHGRATEQSLFPQQLCQLYEAFTIHNVILFCILCFVQRDGSTAVINDNTLCLLQQVRKHHHLERHRWTEIRRGRVGNLCTIPWIKNAELGSDEDFCFWKQGHQEVFTRTCCLPPGAWILVVLNPEIKFSQLCFHGMEGQEVKSVGKKCWSLCLCILHCVNLSLHSSSPKREQKLSHS